MQCFLFRRLAHGAVALFLGITSACAGNPAVQLPAPTPARPGLSAIRVNGTVLNYRDSSTGPSSARPVILVHGTMGNLEEWRTMLGELSKSRRTITYSRRYHQPNPQVDDGLAYSAKLHADDLAALITALHLRKVDVVGSSYGGAVVFELARRHPGMVHALVLDEPAVVMFRPGTLDSLKALMGPGPVLIDSSRAMFARGDSTRALEAFVNATLGPNAFNRLDAGTRRYFASQMLELRKEMSVPASTWVPELRCEDGRPLTMPLLLITGGATLDMYRVLNQQIAGCLPAARLAVVPKVGHHKPDAPAFVTTVRDFFDSVTP